MNTTKADKGNASGVSSIDTELQKNAGSRSPKTYSSRDLFGPGSEICIDHAGFLYRLRITKQGKLILNK
ncbi:MAG: hemin uptake protein HemP [Rhizobiaceae bacterium]|jgi:hemin uptake protein HemP|nr:hemin uptake protein HemP [Rhizobiaceae bacterium]